MKQKSAIFGAALVAAFAVAGANSGTSMAQAPAAQAAPQGRGGGDTPAPARKQGEGTGPYKKMVIRSVTLIDGTGGPPLSPMDIVIEGNKITAVRQAGWPGMTQPANREPRDADFEIDGKGMYVMPGFVDTHVHGSTRGKAPDLELLLQALAGARRDHGSRRVAVVGRGQQLGEESLGGQRDRGAAHHQLPDAGVGLDQRRGDHAGEGA